MFSISFIFDLFWKFASNVFFSILALFLCFLIIYAWKQLVFKVKKQIFATKVSTNRSKNKYKFLLTSSVAETKQINRTRSKTYFYASLPLTFFCFCFVSCIIKWVFVGTVLGSFLFVLESLTNSLNPGWNYFCNYLHIFNKKRNLTVTFDLSMFFFCFMLPIATWCKSIKKIYTNSRTSWLSNKSGNFIAFFLFYFSKDSKCKCTVELF